MCGREENGAGVPSFDEVEAAGLDGTGRDGDPRFPYDEIPSESVSESGVTPDGRCRWCGMPTKGDPEHERSHD